jgi:hypothetical protein
MAKSKNCFAARCKAESNNDVQFGKANRCLPCVNSVLHLISIAPALTAIASTASHFSTRARPTTPLPRHLLRPGSATPSPHPTRRDPPAPRSTSHELPATTEGARRRRRRRSSLPPPPEELESPELRKGSRSACGTFFPKLPPRATSSSRPAAASTCLHGSTFSRAAAAPGLLPVHRRVRPPPGPPSCPASSRTPLSLSWVADAFEERGDHDRKFALPLAFSVRGRLEHAHWRRGWQNCICLLRWTQLDSA